MGAEREYGKLYPVARAIVRPTMRALWRINVTGLHHVPESGPAIFCPNHISFIDSLVLPCVLSRQISYVGKAEYMDSWKTKYLFPAIGMIPIDRGGGSASQRALDTAARVLDRGELFGIYPEGTRSRDGKLHRGHTGPARLALRTGAPIIPVGLKGTDRMQPAGAPLPTPFISCQVNIGAPIDVTRYADRADDRLVLRQLIDEVMFEIRKLSGQEYVDTYANKKADATGEATEPAVPTPMIVSEPSPDGRHPAEIEREVASAEVNQPSRILVGAGGPDVDELDAQQMVDQRRSSADVLAKWWS
ncbi:MAG: lysophospholipid acyltransferase family protein [Acidimicrobiia bacterium]